MVQTPVVRLVYDFVPAPKEADDVIVGLVVLNMYEPVYEPVSIVSVRFMAVILNEMRDEVATVYEASAVICAPRVHVPMLTKVTTPLEELIVQTSVE